MLVRLAEPEFEETGLSGTSCNFIGYFEKSKTYRLVNLESTRVMMLCDITFDENMIPK